MPLERLYDFSPGSVIRSAEIDAEFDQLVKILNGQKIDESVYIGGDAISNTLSPPMLLVIGQSEFTANGSGRVIGIFKQGEPDPRVALFNTGQIRTVSSQNPATPSTTLIVLKGTYSCDTAHVGNVGSGEDDLIVQLIGGHTLEGSIGQYLQIRASGYTAANANNKTIKGYFGGSNFFTSGAVAFNNKPWFFEGDLVINNNTANNFRVTGIFECDTTKVHVDTVVGPFDATLDQILKFTGEATTTNDIVQTKLIVEKGFGLN